MQQAAFVALLETGILCQIGTNPGHQHAGGEGLFDIIIGTQPQTPDLVQILGAGGHQQNGHIQLLPQVLQQGEAVHFRQHHVQ